MSNTEILQQIILSIVPTIWSVLFCFVVVLATCVVAYIFQRDVWVNKKNFKLVCLFYGLDSYDCLCLACSYIELVLLVFYLIQFKKLELINYIVYAVPALVMAFNIRSIKKAPIRALLFAIEMFGLILLNIICGYILDVYAYVWYEMIYVFGSILIALLGFYRFLLSIEDISNLRNIKVKEINEKVV